MFPNLDAEDRFQAIEAMRDVWGNIMTKNPREQEVRALADRLYYDDGLRLACAKLIKMQIAQIESEKNQIEFGAYQNNRYSRFKQLDQSLCK
jgi:hypothetical protein